jgi:hypothetical protein
MISIESGSARLARSICEIALRGAGVLYAVLASRAILARLYVPGLRGIDPAMVE